MANLQSMAERQWLTMGLARTLLGINEATLRHWADTGRVRVFRTPGGHRRFSAEDIQALIDAGSRTGTVHLGEDQAVLPRIRRRVNTTRPRQPAWMAKFDERAHIRMRKLGRAFLSLCTAYVDNPDKHALRQATDLGRDYGDASSGSGLQLQEAMEAFVFFRKATIDAIKPTLVRQATSTEEVWNALDQVSRLTDQVLIGLTIAYQEGQR